MKRPSKPTAALLADQAFFRGVPWRPLERIAELAAYANFVEGTTIFGEGEEATAFYLILNGRVALRGVNARSEPATLQVLEAGDPLGWSWAFPPGKWKFSAVALEPVETIMLDAVKLRMLCDQDPVMSDIVYRRVADVLLQRLTAVRRRLTAMEHAAAGMPLRVSLTSS